MTIPSRYCLVTVTTSDYLHRAMALVARCRELDDTASCRVYVIGLADADITKLNERNRYHQVSYHNLPEDRLKFSLADLASRYTAMEMCCLAKPIAVLDALSEVEVVVYSDTDVYLCSSLQAAVTELDSGRLLLTPHITQPLPTDRAFPEEFTYLTSGLYNAGLFVASQAAEEIMDWWLRHIEEQCYLDYSRALNADQKWLDLSPLIFTDVVSSKNPGLNAGYWTLTHHPFTEGKVGDYNLIAFHFSGLDADNLASLSKHQDREEAPEGLIEMARDYLARQDSFLAENLPVNLSFQTSRTRRFMRWLSTELWRIQDGILRRWPRA